MPKSLWDALLVTVIATGGGVGSDLAERGIPIVGEETIFAGNGGSLVVESGP